MKPSKETLIRIANQTGFRPEILEKVLQLIDLLNAIFADEFLASRLALKGGTALNLFYFDLPRLSVDIDLNYVKSLDRDIMLTEKEQVLTRLEHVCHQHKYRIEHQPQGHAGGKWLLRYPSALAFQGQLEIDLNFIARAALWPIQPMHSIQIDTYRAHSIPVLDYHDLIGGKLAALFARHKSRDLFDVYTLFTQSTIKPDMAKVKLAFMVYGAAAKLDIRKLSLTHLDFHPRELKNMLLPVLRQDMLQAAQDVKPWANQLVQACKDNLKDVIQLNKNEQQFITSLLETGQIRPELITEDQALMKTISQHPVLIWKARHVNP